LLLLAYLLVFPYPELTLLRDFKRNSRPSFRGVGLRPTQGFHPCTPIGIINNLQIPYPYLLYGYLRGLA
jgi:hypothetical protein